MKLTRKLILVLLAAGVLLGLSSCNAMLDAIYPERQVVVVTVDVPRYHDALTPGSYASVSLTDSSANVLTTYVATTPTSYDSSYWYYDFQFTKQKNASYGLYSYFYSWTANWKYYNNGGAFYFWDPSNTLTYTVTVPYYQSQDITDLIVQTN